MKVNSSRILLFPCNTSGCRFCDLVGLKETLDKATSCCEFSTIIVDVVVRDLLNASQQQKLKPCMVKAIREIISACRRTKLPIGPLTEFYEFRKGGKTVPTWLILHSTSADDQLTTSTRHWLLQTYLDELGPPPTPSIQNELYLACAEKGYNNYFDRIRLASLGCLQARAKLVPVMYKNLRDSFKLPTCPSETLTIVDTKHGFKLEWFVPDMLPLFQSGFPIGIEFLAKGLIWGFYIQNQYFTRSSALGWDIVLCVLKPSQNNLKGDVVASLKISRYGKRKLFGRRSTRFDLYSDHIETSGFPQKRCMPNTQTLWLLPTSATEKCYRCINKDGSCYLTLDLVINPTSREDSP